VFRTGFVELCEEYEVWDMKKKELADILKIGLQNYNKYGMLKL